MSSCVELKLKQPIMKQIINDFINSIDTKLYSRIRESKGDAECRRFLKDHLSKQLLIHSVVVNEAVCEHENEDWVYDESGIDMHCIKCEENSEVELVCDCNDPDICQDNTELIYCFECKKPMTQTN